MNSILRELRQAQALTQQKLADAVQVSRQTIISIETGKYDPSLPLALKIARFLEVRIEDIVVPEDD